MVHLFLTIIRALFALIDSLVVFLIKNLYVLLIQIANTNVFGDFIYQILGRIYVFLGVFMLFKLSMSMITYIINPDALTDKSKGFGKLITNVVISLILIVTVPTIFKEAFKLQYTILNSNAIYQIVTGRELPDATTQDGKSQLEANAEAMGETIATEVYSLFIYKAEGGFWDLPDKVNKPIDEDGNPCADLDCMLKLDTINNTENASAKNFGFTNVYWFILSTLAGGVVAYFFLVFCLDAAMRSIKLGMLQIVAPIPILSMIDPKAGTDKVKKWASECGKEFAGLFIRLAGVFFAVAIIQLVSNGFEGVDNAFHYYAPNGGSSDTPASLFVKLFIIIGALMFAKELPKWIENVLGIKLSGGDGFNLKKRIGGALGGAALLAGGAMLGRASAAVGKTALNTANAGARLGASSLVNKLRGKDNTQAMDKFKQRMAYTGQEAKGRFTSLNKKYSGDTYGALAKKDKAEVKAGKKEVKDFDKSLSRGQVIKDNLDSLMASGMTEADANKVIFGDRYGESMNQLKDAKINKITAQQTLESYQRNLQAAMNAKANGSTSYNGKNVDSYIEEMTDYINGTNNSGSNTAKTNYSKAVIDAQDKIDKLNEAHKALQKADTTHAKMEADLKTYKTIK